MPYAQEYNYGNLSTTDEFWCGEAHPITVEGTTNLYVLSKDEWYYLFNSRFVEGWGGTSLCKSFVTVTNGGTTYNNCVIIAPDGYNPGTDPLKEEYTTLDEVNSKGLVCLPGAGYRSGSDINPTVN